MGSDTSFPFPRRDEVNMDHLLLLSTPHNHLEIPYFGGEVYDGSGFFTYPDRQNWDPRHLRDGNYGSRSTTEAASLAQAWLYFGALSEVTGIPIRGTNFIRVSPTTGRLIITTERLNFYLERWRARTARATTDRQKQSREIAKLCLDFMIMFTVPNLLVPEHPEVAVSIEILLTTLVDTFKEIYGIKAWHGVPSVFADSKGNVDYLPGGNGHVIRHVKPHCECGFVQADVGEAVKIIQQGKIPIASIIMDEQQRVRLDITPYQDGMMYIAISHVWSHGLGNPDYNALRTCQLLQLDRLLKDTYHDHFDSESEDTDKTYFWIDTLCLPLRPIQWRKAAIKQMRHCYDYASAVLVLDKHLRRSTAYTPTKTTELLLQIVISDWRFRVWTLQEAIFAKKLIFQFLDASVDAEELLTFHFASRPLEESLEKVDHVDMFLMVNLAPALGINTNLESAREKGGLLRVRNSSLSGLMFSLQGRAISKPEDEPVCAASLLDQDHVLSAILECPRKEERMKVFWRTQHRIPAWVPFIDGPKLEDPGYKWAPSTLRYRLQGVATGSGLDEYGEIHPDGLGLVIRRPGFVLLERESTRTLEDNTWGENAFSLKDDQGLRYDVARSPDKLNPSLPDLHGGKLSVAVIVSEWADTHHPQVLIVSIADETEDEVIRCSIISRGIIIVKEDFPQVVFPPDSVDSYKARQVRDDQGWLLD
ncbi:hypothetical protein CNMCM6106_001684 [Aspergillus hiratsukae]|uniref:Heterokaryon incompatibility domain-containing protein n=1 Tax=Aspergillus hiratsukae TaxID=1194566 RepID=A0A8H6Q3Z4_9EURO|nr:hypothetical protein CNMCM6106_001684 [Aspergillus hiratsukae]